VTYSPAAWWCACGTYNGPAVQVCQWCDCERVYGEPLGSNSPLLSSLSCVVCGTTAPPEFAAACPRPECPHKPRPPAAAPPVTHVRCPGCGANNVSTRRQCWCCEQALTAAVPSPDCQSQPQPQPSVPGLPLVALQALMFYADPENWHGVYAAGPGPMTDDWSSDPPHPAYPHGKPGRAARHALTLLCEAGLCDPDQPVPVLDLPPQPSPPPPTPATPQPPPEPQPSLGDALTSLKIRELENTAATLTALRDRLGRQSLSAEEWNALVGAAHEANVEAGVRRRGWRMVHPDLIAKLESPPPLPARPGPQAVSAAAEAVLALRSARHPDPRANYYQLGTVYETRWQAANTIVEAVLSALYPGTASPPPDPAS